MSSGDTAVLHADMRVAEAARILAAPLCTQVDAGWQAVLDDDGPAGPHALRVGFRKLRVVLRIFRGDEEDAKIRAISQAVLVMARRVGPMRDLDVLINDIVAPPGSAEALPGQANLVALLDRERTKARTALRRRLNSQSARALQSNIGDLPSLLNARLETTHGKERIGKLARHDLRRRWRRIGPETADFDTAGAEGLHELRKSLKNLRYAFACFAPLWDDKPATAFDAQLRRLQSSFGYLNDVAGARALPARLGDASRDPDISCAIGFVLGWHSERAEQMRKALDGQWGALQATKVAGELAKR